MNRNIVKVILAVFTIALIISLYILIKDILEYKKNYNSSIKLIEQVVKEDENDKIEIDWEQLECINKDVIGWIRIENTNINYPILKDDYNLKYLKHSFNQEYNRNGAIFTLNDNPFQDNITTIYGHNRKNKIMFSELDKFMNEEFLKEHLNFEIFTKKQKYIAKIFSCYSINVNEEERNINKLNFQEEIEYYQKSSQYPINSVGKIERIVKLSTCAYLNNYEVQTNQRYYIVAKLEKID